MVNIAPKDMIKFAEKQFKNKKIVTLSVPEEFIQELDNYVGNSRFISRSTVVSYLLKEFVSSKNKRPIDSILEFISNEK